MAGASSALQTKRELGKATRDAFGRALEALGEDHPNVVVVDGDVGNSTRTEWFGKKYPERFFNVGIAESNLVGVAAGLAASGKTSVIASFAAFIMCNAYDQLRMSVAYPGLERQGRRQPRGHLDRRGRSIADGDRRRCPGLCAAGLRGDRPGRRPVGPRRDRRDARVQRARSICASAVPKCRAFTPATRPLSRSARPTRSATGPTSPSSPTA